jgi:hypothetical protein
VGHSPRLGARSRMRLTSTMIVKGFHHLNAGKRTCENDQPTEKCFAALPLPAGDIQDRPFCGVVR